jgi:hypothetical protein
MTLIEECKAALPGATWEQKPWCVEAAWIYDSAAHTLAVQRRSENDGDWVYCHLYIGGGLLSLVGKRTVREAIAACRADIKGKLGPLWPSDPAGDRLLAFWRQSPQAVWKNVDVDP